VKRNWWLKLLALFLSLIVAFIIVLFGAAVAPPRYTVQASFRIDWGLLPMSLQLHKSKEEIAKIRSDTIALITRPDMNRVAGQICFLHGIPDSSAPFLARKLSRFLKVSLTGTKDTQDFFKVQYRDNSAAAASLVCRDVASRQKDIVNFDIIGKDVSEVVKTIQENQDLAQKQQDLKGALYELRQEQEQEFSSERERQIQEYRSELNGLGDVEVKTDVDQFEMVIDLFAPDPVQIDKNIAVKRRGGAYGIFVLSVAGLGGIATLRVAIFFLNISLPKSCLNNIRRGR
jgi:hypothetical protein